MLRRHDAASRFDAADASEALRAMMIDDATPGLMRAMVNYVRCYA